MKMFSSLSVRTKLTVVVAGIPTLALIIVFAGFLINNVSMLREAKYSQLKTQAEILAFNCSAALQLKQREECKALLEPIVSQPTVELVGLYNSDDKEFLVVAGDSHFELEVPELQNETTVDFTQDGFLNVWFPIRDAGGVIGAVALKANTNDLKQQMRDSVWSALWLVTMTLLTCGLISLISIRGILEPILNLASVAKRITLSEDYSARVTAVTQDEVGELYESFNRLLDRVETTQGDLREASEAKSRFLANTSHEIRTPLNAIMGFVELLQKTGDQITAAERADYLETIRGSSRHLLTLINDILDLSKIEAGQMVYESIRFSPDQVISEVFTVMRAKLEEKSLRLEYKWETPIPATILSDESRFRQLLFNLVGNAVKFTTVGHVTLTACLHKSEELLEIEVADSGIGIPEDKLTSLFQPFVQADSSVTRRFGGTGLGLAICKHISEGLRGTIRVKSELGKGSSFIVTLKTGDLSDVEFTNTAGEQSPIARPAQIESVPDKLPNCRILVVDDGETNRKLIRLMLERAGAQVSMAENGLDAVSMASGEAYDAILMDMQMPVMDGYTATRSLRDAGNTTPIIALTANAMRGDEEVCLAAGCSGYLPKPVDSEMLFATLHLFLPKFPSVPDAAGKPQRTPEIRSTLPLDDPEFAEIVDEFIDQLQSKIVSAESALCASNLEEVGTFGHWLKGAGGMAGFTILMDLGAEIQRCSKENDWSEVRSLMSRLRKVLGSLKKRGKSPVAASTGKSTTSTTSAE